MPASTAALFAQDLETSAGSEAVGLVVVGAIIVALGVIVFRTRQRAIRHYYEGKRHQKEYEERLRDQPDLE